MKLDVAILGASGYGGGELLRWLSGHPAVNSLRGTARTLAGEPFWKAHPNLRGVVDGSFEEDLDWQDFANCEQPVVFAALSHGALAERLPELERGLAGGRARGPAAAGGSLRGLPAPGPRRLRQGLQEDPSLPRAPARASSTACPSGTRPPSRAPGASPTQAASPRRSSWASSPCAACQLGFLAASAATGSSGSGASPSEGTHHPLRAQDFRAYKVLGHQHLPEVHMAMAACGVAGTLAFVPQSAPMVRGIFATLMFPLPEGLDAKALKARAELAFQDCPFVRLVEDSPKVTAVTGSNFADISVAAKEGAGVVLVAIDNLCKGMASQAVQNMNLALGLPETVGLRIAGRFPA